MALGDDLLKTFLQHEYFSTDKYNNVEDLPIKLADALKSDDKVIRTIGIIISAHTDRVHVTDNDLLKQINKFLNNAI